MTIKPLLTFLLDSALVATIATTVLAAGCGRSGPKTHPVAGQVRLVSGDVAALAGHTVEFALDANSQVRAAGEIQPDGTFQLESFGAGRVSSGAPAGKYQARIVLSDDDPARRTAAAKLLPARYLRFDQAGLTAQVPTSGTVGFEIKRR